MNPHIKNLPLLPVLITGILLMLAGRLAAQTFTTLHSFTGINGDGSSPVAALVLSENILYGTTLDGGTNKEGIVFALNIDGTDFTVLHNFTYYNDDGGAPGAGLMLSGHTLYGTASDGGANGNGNGTVFAVNTDGTGFMTLHVFTALINNVNSDGASPRAGLVLTGTTLYGTTRYGGTSGNGTVFAVNTNGTGFTTLHSFSAYSYDVVSSSVTNSDGAGPEAGLVISGNTLYGTASIGGSSANGTIFALNTNGSGFSTLYTFTPSSGYFQTNSDGAHPQGGLSLSSNTLYGTAYGGGSAGYGTVFKVNSNGSGFATLHSFTEPIDYMNNDGANPQADVILSGNTLYGTALHGGSGGNGSVFSVSTDGTGFRNLHSFTGNSDGLLPDAGLILSDNTLYGTASFLPVEGTVFSLSLGSASLVQPQLAIVLSGPNVILMWPTNYTGFTLQSTMNLSSSTWGAVSQTPVVANTNNVVTNAISNKQYFFRLSQ